MLHECFRDCEEVASSLEIIEPEMEKYNVQFVKIYNKRYARSIGIRYVSHFMLQIIIFFK